MKPTQENYTTLQSAYDYFNRELFNNQLPQCLITLQRKNGAMGYFSSKRFRSMVSDGKITDEIALNPATFDTPRGNMEIMQTLVHEMCHLWQYHFGKPSRSGYHNREWANKMESIGLIPSSTGKEGGKKTGQSMADYVELNGRFMQAYEMWSKSNQIEWADNVSVGAGAGTHKTKSKVKFSCDCGQNAWAKPTAVLACGVCSTDGALVYMVNEG